MSSTLSYPMLKAELDLALMGRGTFVLRALTLVAGYYYIYAQAPWTEGIARAFSAPARERPVKVLTYYHTTGARRGYYSPTSGAFGFPITSIEEDANNIDAIR
jgi:hypothetical protein